MTLKEAIELLKSEGIQATEGQLRYAIRKGRLSPPRRFMSQAYEFDGRTMRSVRSYFLRDKKERG